ncbi:MAG: hypothetical protein C4345_02350, partial [Chloroflexota bacterium]
RHQGAHRFRVGAHGAAGEEERALGRAWLRAQPALAGEVRRWMVVHAGSGGAWKCWPAARYAELCLELWRKFGAAVLLVEGP